MTPLATAAETFAGPAGRTVMIVGATLSMFGYLSFAALAGPRSLFAFARDGLLPRALASVHDRYRTPWIAIITYCCAGLLMAMSGTFETLAVLANLSAILLYAMCAISAWNLRRRGVRLEQEPFVTPGGPLIPVLTCAGCAWLFYETLLTVDVIYRVAGGLVLAALVAIYFARAAFAARAPARTLNIHERSGASRGAGAAGGGLVPERREPIHGGCGRNVPVPHAPERGPHPQRLRLSCRGVHECRAPARGRFVGERALDSTRQVAACVASASLNAGDDDAVVACAGAGRPQRESSPRRTRVATAFHRAHDSRRRTRGAGHS